MGGTAIATIVATLISGIAAVIVGYYTQQAAAKAATISSRTDIEREAFERAKTFYTGVIDRQDHDIQELEEDVQRLRARVAALEREVDETRVELHTAKRLLRLRYPDDPA